MLCIVQNCLIYALLIQPFDWSCSAEVQTWEIVIDFYCDLFERFHLYTNVQYLYFTHRLISLVNCKEAFFSIPLLKCILAFPRAIFPAENLLYSSIWKSLQARSTPPNFMSLYKYTCTQDPRDAFWIRLSWLFC